MSKWLDICSLASIGSDSGVCALVKDAQVAIFRVGNSNELYAIDNFDPFSKANVLSRGLIGDLKGELMVASPVYKQHFSLITGKCFEEEDVQLKTYKVRVEKERVEISI